MRLDLENLPQDIAVLHRLVRDLAAGVEQRESELDKLRLLVRQLQRGQFGRRSERLDPDQLQFGLEELDADIARVMADAPEQPVPRAPEHEVQRRATFAAHLPREDAHRSPRKPCVASPSSTQLKQASEVSRRNGAGSFAGARLGHWSSQ